MTESLTIKWSSQKKILFLFILCYTFFYIFPFPFDAFLQLDFIFKYYEKAYNLFVLFVGKHVLHVEGLKKLVYSDSGDTLFDFVKFFIFLFVSLFAAIVILFLDLKRDNYEKLQGYLFIYLRYCIGFYMLVYGFDKVFKSHFPFPSLEKLQQPLGESSPQGLLWAFMGYSTTYSVYLGIVEVCSGFLLLFRKTTALGALLVLIIMINVTIINFSYDVPVKLFALHMVAFAFILSYPFLNSVFNFFILKKASQLPEQAVVVFPKWIQSYRNYIKTAAIIAFTALFMSFSITNMRTDGDNAPKPALYGIYVATLGQNTFAENTRAEEIIFDREYTVFITNKETQYYETYVDATKRRILFISNKDPLEKFIWYYSLSNDHLCLAGTGQACLGLHFDKVDQSQLPLINRGFHWVVEYPVNN